VIVTHTTDLRCISPINDDVDCYEVDITLTREIMVEEIRKVLKLYTSKKATQEEVTENLASYLGSKVTTRGQHSEFHTVCTVDHLPVPPCVRPGMGLGSNEE